MPDQRILVVGTTPDYVDIIRSRFCRQALFLTDFDQRAAAREISPASEEEILCDLNNFGQTLFDLNQHLFEKKISISGISCFDCESLELAAYLAEDLRLRFPSSQSILRCRNKFLTKQIWKRAGIPCPDANLVEDIGQLRHVMMQLPGPAILKPMTGSGSELVFKGADLKDACRAFDVIQRQLAIHPNARMYGETKQSGMVYNSRSQILVEEFIDGTEYSCDFVLDGDKLEIIRLTSKIPDPDQTTGTTLAYIIPGQGFGPERIEPLERQLLEAARALDLDHAVCMADFIVSGDTVFLLEITPRPGGDCLPPLIMASSGLDAIGLALKFSAGKSIEVPEKSNWKTRVGVRIFALSAGVVQDIDARALRSDDAIISCHFKAYPGCRVELPPKDYDSRVLGHVIFRPDPKQPIISQCKSITSNIVIRIGN
jgi:biotin carboxylase